MLTKNPLVYALWAVVLVGVGLLVYRGMLQWPIATGFLVTLGLPSVLKVGA